MTRVRLSVDVDSELRRRVRLAAASKDQSVKEWLEAVLERGAQAHGRGHRVDGE